MKSKVIILSLFVTCLLLSAAMSAQKTIPDVEVQTLEGQRKSIADHASNGKITMLNFWATWCSPCKKELDAISDVYAEWQEKYDLEILAISVDNARSMAKVGPLVAEKGWDYQIYLDPNEQLKNSLNFRMVPQTYILDTDGNIVYDHSGYVPGSEWELEEIFEEIVNGK